MDSIKQILDKNENLIKKNIDTTDLVLSTASSTSGKLTPRQDLDPVIVDLARRVSPFRSMVRREKGVGSAFTFNLVESVFASGEDADPREMFYADGGLPVARSTKYKTVTVPYKSIGLQGNVTGLAEAMGEEVVDLYAKEVEMTTQRIIQGEEWLAFWSDTSTTNDAGLTGFAGLNSLITTNVIDAQGGAMTKTLIDQAANLIAQQGGQATHMFTSIRVGIKVNSLYDQYSQVIINQNDRQALTLGNMVRNISTVAGVLDIVPDFFLNPGNTYPVSNGTFSSPSGATTSTVFILAMPYISMKDLKPLGMEELGRTADKRDFYVNEYTALKLTAEPWCAKIINVSDAI